MHVRSAKYLFLSCIVVSVLLFGCNSTHYGGAPEPSFDVDKDLKQLAKYFGDADSIKGYYERKSRPGVSGDELKAARDEFIAARLTMMNIRYIQFIRQSTSDKQLLDSSVDILGIGLNIAGVSFDSAATKTALAGIAAGVSGSKAVIDKNYYFEKTIPALIAAMNAQRKKALVPILDGVQKDISDYTFEEAVTDLHNYYFAGTFIGAIQVIQADAGVKEQAQDRSIAIAKYGPVTKADVTLKERLTSAIGKLEEKDLKKAQDALALLEEPGEAVPQKLQDAKDALQYHVKKARNPKQIKDLAKVFQAAEIEF
jgi:hypothetical protein